MLFETAPTCATKCCICKNPIVRREARIRWHGGGYYCYECGLKYLEKKIEEYKRYIPEFRKYNHIWKKNRVKLKTMLNL